VSVIGRCNSAEAETQWLQALRQRADDQLRGMYGHLASIVEGVHRGIDGIQELGEEVEPEAAGPVPLSRPLRRRARPDGRLWGALVPPDDERSLTAGQAGTARE
jgi:hypothetical protein